MSEAETLEFNRNALQGTDGVLSPEKAAELDALQEVAANDALNFLDVKTEKDQFPLIAMATGIGKGRIIHKIIERSVRKKPDAKILVIAGTKITLVDQTQSALAKYSGINNGSEREWEESEFEEDINEETEDVSQEKFEKSFLYSTVDYKNRKRSTANVHVATIQTIQSESKKDVLNPEDYDLVIVDEAHNIGTQPRVDTVKRFKNVIGFTATPFRHSGVLKEPEHYGFTIINSLTLPEAQEKEFLPPLTATAIPTDHLVDEIPTNLKGEIDYKRLERLLKNSPDLRPFIADKIQGYIFDGYNKKKTIVAVNFVWEAEELARLIKEKGISVGIAVNLPAAKLIHSEEIPALDAIDRYKLPKNDPNSLQVLISPYVASEGFDAPLTEVLAWASPTDSSVRYTQFTGRLARRAPEKQFGQVIDFLYQTTQYKWAYNFGQWMKDTVVQLPNGTLFQGSGKQLQQVIPTIEKVSSASAGNRRVKLSELQDVNGYLLPQGNEYKITSENLFKTFRGDANMLLGVAREIINELRITYPNIVFERRSGSSVVPTVKDFDLFEGKMLERGIEVRRPLLPLKEGELPITIFHLRNIFVGKDEKIMAAAQEVVGSLQGSNSDLVLERRNRGQIFAAVTDRNLFIERMKERGVKEKERVDEPHANDFLLNQKSLTRTFSGTYDKVHKIAQGVLEELKMEHPTIIQSRKNGPSVVPAVTDGRLFIQKMLDHGAILKTEPLSEGEFPITQKWLRATFKGGTSHVYAASNDVLQEIQRHNPELLVIRRNGNNIVTALRDKNFFIQKMREREMELRINN